MHFAFLDPKECFRSAKISIISLNDDSTPAVIEFTTCYKISKCITATSGKALCFAVGLQRHTNGPNQIHRSAFCWEKFELMLDEYFSRGNYLTEMRRNTRTHTSRNAYFNYLASFGTVLLSTICPFVSNSIVTFSRECVYLCVFALCYVCVCVYYHWRAHMLVYPVCVLAAKCPFG